MRKSPIKVKVVTAVFIALMTSLFLSACLQEQEKTPPQPSGSAAGSSASGALFRFSREGSIAGRSTAGNWCYRHYPEAVLVSAPPDNTNRRFFDAPPGIYKIIVPIGKVTASLLLRSYGGAQAVEVYTSDQLPECLSNAANFSLNADGTVLSYDNRENIRFTVQAQPNGSAMRISLDLPVGLNYGVEVRLCDNCED